MAGVCDNVERSESFDGFNIVFFKGYNLLDNVFISGQNKLPIIKKFGPSNRVFKHKDYYSCE